MGVGSQDALRSDIWGVWFKIVEIFVTFKLMYDPKPTLENLPKRAHKQQKAESWSVAYYQAFSHTDGLRALKFSFSFHSVDPERNCLDERLRTSHLWFSQVEVHVPLYLMYLWSFPPVSEVFASPLQDWKFYLRQTYLHVSYCFIQEKYRRLSTYIKLERVTHW